MRDIADESSKLAYISRNDTNPPSYREDESRFYFGDLTTSASESLEIACVGNIKHGEKYTVNREHFDYYGIFILLDGKLILDFEGKKSLMNSGSIIAYSPQSKFSMKTPPNGTGCRKLFALFKGSQAKSILEESGLKIGVPKRLINPAFIHGIFENILDCAYFSHEAGAHIAADLLRIVFKTVKLDSSMTTDVVSDSYFNFLRCKKFIQMNFKRLNFVHEIAAECHMNESYLSRFFKKHAKVSPLKYLTNLKIEYAKNMLIHGGMNVKATANEVGFKDAYHFSKVFKNVCGVAPKKFIETSKNKISTTTNK